MPNPMSIDAHKVRFELQARRIMKALETRQMEAYYAADKAEALKIAMSLIPDGTSVGWGGSVTIDQVGLQEALYVRGTNDMLDRDKGDRDEIMRKIFFADYFLTSTNAISEDGVLVNIDGTCNRIAAIAFGPKNVIMIVGRNKVAKDEDEALLRAKNIAAPVNAMRFNIDTPCKKTGVCMDCLVPTCVCRQVLTTRCSKNGRIKVILVNEDLGF